MKKISSLVLFFVIMASGVNSQGSWAEPVSIKDFYLVINAIRTEPKRFIPRVKALFEDQRNTSGVHNILGVTYTDLQITTLKNYLDTTGTVQAVELDRGLTYVAWKHAKHMSAMNNLGTGIGPTGLTFPQRVGAMGTYTGDLQEVRALTHPQGHTAEMVILSRMLLSTTDRDIIRNPNHTKLGVGVDKRINQYYVDLIFSQSFTCTNCHNISDAEEVDMHWNQYLRDWYNPPDTDGNLRIGRSGQILSMVLVAFIGLASLI